jgi:hypothetical protein
VELAVPSEFSVSERSVLGQRAPSMFEFLKEACWDSPLHPCLILKEALGRGGGGKRFGAGLELGGVLEDGEAAHAGEKFGGLGGLAGFDKRGKEGAGVLGADGGGLRDALLRHEPHEFEEG